MTIYDIFTCSFVVVAIIVVVAFNVRNIIAMPKEEKIKQIKAWLLGAVIEAEKLFGSGTGKLKLSFVYDKFVEKFPWLAKVITFTQFSFYVDDVLEEMRSILSSNESIANIVNGDE